MLKRNILVLLLAGVIGLTGTALAGAAAPALNQNLPGPSRRALAVGTRGADVAQLQTRLKNLGYLDGPADGSFGPQTQNAVAAFQRDYGLPVSDVAGVWTAHALAQATGDQPGESAADAPPAGLPEFNDLNPVVMGYYVEYWDGDTSSLNSMAADRDQLNLVVSFQYGTDAFGNLTGRQFPALMGAAAARNVHVFALIHNWDDQLAGFSRATATQMIITSAAREQTAARMIEQVKGRGFTGLNLDLENVPPALRQQYTEFVAILAAGLHAEDMILSLSIPAKRADNPADGWSGAFDYAALGRLADLIVIMSYDEHSPGYAAGPVASYHWADQVMAYAAGQIPPEKLLLGIAAYAYDWVEGTTGARALGVPAAQALAAARGADIMWDAEGRVPYFRYVDDLGRRRIVWFEDAASTAAKLELVTKHRLRGIGIWRLGLEDPGVWPVIEGLLSGGGGRHGLGR